ncbi:MAG: hypothetical protein R2800_04420 [Flavipsychrobacter sp.]
MSKTFVKFAESLDMSEIPKIITSDILDNNTDDFWEDLPKEMQDLDPKNVLVITTKMEDNSPEQAQLDKILAACQLEKANYFLIALEEDKQMAWHKLKAHFLPETVLLFGILPQKLGISSLFRINSINNFDGCTFIPALSIQKMEEQLEAKKQLWTNALKPHFIDTKTT